MKTNRVTDLKSNLQAYAAAFLIIAGFANGVSWATTAGTLANLGLRDVYARKGETVRVPVVLSYYSDEERQKVESVGFKLELSESHGYRIRCPKRDDAARGEWRTFCESQSGGHSIHVIADSREGGPRFESGTEIILELIIETGPTVTIGDTCRMLLSNVRVTTDKGDLHVGSTPGTIHIVKETESCDFYHGVFSILDMVFHERNGKNGRSWAEFDVDGDGSLSVRDAVYLSLHEAALISELPLCATSSGEDVPHVVKARESVIEILPPEKIPHSTIYKYHIVARNIRGLLGADISLRINDGLMWDGPKKTEIPFHQLKAGTDSSDTHYRIVFTTNLPIDTDDEIKILEVKVQQNTNESVFSQESFTYYVLDTVPSSTTEIRGPSVSNGKWVPSYTVSSSHDRINIAGTGTAGNDVEYDVLDLHGRIILRGRLNGTGIMHSLPPAHYIVRIRESWGERQLPIVVHPH